MIRWSSRRLKSEHTIEIHQKIETTANMRMIEIETFKVCGYEPQLKNSQLVPGQTFSSFPFCEDDIMNKYFSFY